MTLRLPLVVLLLASACSSSTPIQDPDGGSLTGTGSTTDSNSGSGMVEPGTTAVADGSGTGPGPSSTGDVDFIADPDVTHPGFACDLDDQDCPDGYKCVPLSIESWWDGTACVPVVPDPQGIGEPCMVPDPTTGADDCGYAQFCWQLDETGVGECIGLCLPPAKGAPEWEFTCEDPQARPSIGCQECFCMCIRQCDPLLQDCNDGQACYPSNDGWECATDASKGGGGQDAGCEFLNVCAEGHVCVNPSAVPTCDGSNSGCCTAVCDLSAPDTCPGQELGMSCVPWYEPGMAPAGYENVGVCGVL